MRHLLRIQFFSTAVKKELFQILNLGGGTFYKVLVRNIFSTFLQNIAMFQQKQEKHRFVYCQTYPKFCHTLDNFELRGLEVNVILYLHSRTN